MESLRLSVFLVGHHSMATFVPLVVLSLSSFSPVSGQSYQHNRSSVFFLVTTLSVRDIAVGIQLLIAFGFPMMLLLTSLILSSPMLILLMSRLIFLTWFSFRLTLPIMSPPPSPPPSPPLPPRPPILYHYTRRPRPSPRFASPSVTDEPACFAVSF
jgi:hypothetical protein